MKNYLKEGLEKLNINLDENVIDKLIRYNEFMLEYNKITNLTAIRDKKESLEKHFIDSLMLYNFIGDDVKTAIDIGTGAGFPGMVLAIARPDIEFTLMDSIGKKTKFLEKLKEEIGIDNARVVNARAEEFIKLEGREEYDIGTSRAVADFRIILEYVTPFLKIGGNFLVQKVKYKREFEEAKNAMDILKVSIKNISSFKLPHLNEDRVIIEALKNDKCDEKYPRRAGIPTKRPL